MLAAVRRFAIRSKPPAFKHTLLWRATPSLTADSQSRSRNDLDTYCTRAQHQERATHEIAAKVVRAPAISVRAVLKNAHAAARVAAAPARRRRARRWREDSSVHARVRQRHPKKPVVILRMDGGGCRGYRSIRLLERVCEEAPGFLDRVDLFAGTSTGSILAAFLAGGASPAEAASYYEQYVPAIFGRPRNLVRRAWDAKFSNRPLKDALRTYFGDATVAQLPKHFLQRNGWRGILTSAGSACPNLGRAAGGRHFSGLPAVRARPGVN